LLQQPTDRKGHRTCPNEDLRDPAGSMVPNAADMLMSLQVRDLIAELRGEFDYIVANGAV
jgi:hypothetical protein